MNCSTGTLTARVLGDVRGPAHSGPVSTRAPLVVNTIVEVNHTCHATFQLLVGITVRKLAVTLARVDLTGDENLGRDKLTRSTASLDKAFELVEQRPHEFERKLPVKTFEDYGVVVSIILKYLALWRSPHVKVFSCFLTDATGFFPIPINPSKQRH